MSTFSTARLALLVLVCLRPEGSLTAGDPGLPTSEPTVRTPPEGHLGQPPPRTSAGVSPTRMPVLIAPVLLNRMLS